MLTIYIGAIKADHGFESPQNKISCVLVTAFGSNLADSSVSRTSWTFLLLSGDRVHDSPEVWMARWLLCLLKKGNPNFRQIGLI